MRSNILKPVCRRCGTYMNVLTNGYMCPNCKYQEGTILSDNTTPTERTNDAVTNNVGFYIDLDEHDLNQIFNAIYLSLEAAKDMLNYTGDIKEAIRYIDQGEDKLKKFREKINEYD